MQQPDYINEFLDTSLSAGSKAILVVIVGTLALGSGCGPPTIWSAEARSPDGLWLASARTLENAGVGTGGYVTEVYLRRTNVSQAPQPILSFWHDPMLPSPQSGGTINLAMKWMSPTRLDVTYEGHAEVSFHVVKYANIEISVRDLSSKAASMSRSPLLLPNCPRGGGQELGWLRLLSSCRSTGQPGRLSPHVLKAG